MRLIRFLAFCAWPWIAAVAGAREDGWRVSPRLLRDEVKAVVMEQLEAFRREDIATAYTLATTGTRQQYRLPVYERMIRRGYAPLLGHEKAEPGVVRDDGEAMAILPVIIRDRDGKVRRYRYHLLREGDAWRVGGVLPEASAPKADA